MHIDHRSVFRKASLTGVLDRLLESLELTPTQTKEARARSEAVGAWLASADDPGLRRLSVYFQGSTALGTTVRPIGRNEHDVDLIAHITVFENRNPADIKKLIGDRLKENGRYRPILIEKTRCWRLDYANEFHLDITPSIPNPNCPNGGELVPDRLLRCWKASNPKAYRALFEQRAALRPTLRLAKVAFSDEAVRAGVEPYPETTGFKGLLRRIVQLSKRHRDVYFDGRNVEFAPISIIITTLASKSYEFCVNSFVYDSELDVVVDVLRRMPHFIDRDLQAPTVRWAVWNETTQGENFAERWNQDPRLATAFFEWNEAIVADIAALTETEGMDQITKRLGDSFGKEPTESALRVEIKSISEARAGQRLYVAPRIGLTTAAAMAGAAPVWANTFFGR
jgi:hypothetical protein